VFYVSRQIHMRQRCCTNFDSNCHTPSAWRGQANLYRLFGGTVNSTAYSASNFDSKKEHDRVCTERLKAVTSERNAIGKLLPLRRKISTVQSCNDVSNGRWPAWYV